ncbi:MAG: 4Fe-4S dicluster domain-containing protein [Candidatus Jordarchaeum sp.]|uniref:4Fe-4S dicluster domain-containing protein n=1 Tax=Candidatus Jordarchaeum sp. TaxID=2823881 RepID=UPI00404A41EC
MINKKLCEYADDIYSCMRCGFCIAKCPLYENYGWASNNARGRILIARGILENKLELSHYIAERIFNCTTCDQCYVLCPSGIHTTDIIRALKYELSARNYIPNSSNRIMENIRREGNPYGEPRLKRGYWMRDEDK